MVTCPETRTTDLSQMMKSRGVVLASGVVLAALFATVGTGYPAEVATKYCDGPKVTWKIALFNRPSANTTGLEYVSRYVRDNTCGHFNFKLYYGEQLTRAKETLDAIKVGAIEGGVVVPSYHPGKTRALGVLDLPFLPIYSFDAQRKVCDTLFATETFKKSLAHWGARRWQQGLLPHYEFMGRGTPPRTFEDFKGKRLRALGGMGAAVRAIGAVPTTMPAPETYTALERGTVDAVSLPFSYSFASYRIDELATWYTVNLSVGSVDNFTALSEKAWDKLPQQYREILDASLEGSYTAMIKAYAAEDAINLERWRKSGKMAEILFSDQEREKFRKVGGRPVWDAWVSQSKAEVPDAQALLDLVLKTADDANQAKPWQK